MKARAIAAAVLLCAVAALALPGVAPAATRKVREPGSVTAELNLRGTHRFHLDLWTVPGRGVSLVATRNRGEGLEIVDYSDARRDPPVGDPGRGLLNVRIGRLGHFRGHLIVRSTKTEPPERGCKGEPTTTETGVFVGSFHFRGERDFTRVRASRANGSVTRRSLQHCLIPTRERHPGRESSHRHPKETRKKGEYKLVAAGPTIHTYLEAERTDEARGFPGSAEVSASLTREVRDLTVSRLVSSSSFNSDPSTIFAVPNLAAPLSEATIAPPAPFSGSATFRSDGARSGSWTGDLKVRLPGLAPAPLTGNGIEAGLCVGGAGCTETLPSELQPVLEAPPGVIVAVGTKNKK